MMTTMNRRQLTTVLHLLRYHAEYTRRMHGETLPERPGSIELTPTEMEQWADELEMSHVVDQSSGESLKRDTTLPVTIAMLPNSYHPGPRCSCRECLTQYPLPDWLDT